MGLAGMRPSSGTEAVAGSPAVRFPLGTGDTLAFCR